MEAQGMAPGKKNAKRLGAHIVFVDESGFLMAPPVRKTWGLKGQTPIIRHHQVRQRTSVISGLSVSPKKRRLGVYFNLHEKNICQVEVLIFLRHLLRHLRGHVIVVWDNSRTHRGAQIREFLKGKRRLHLEALPPYAPELNPAEGIWSQAKNTLANGRPDLVEELRLHLVDTLDDIRSSQSNLRACIHKSDLPLFLS